MFGYREVLLGELCRSIAYSGYLLVPSFCGGCRVPRDINLHLQHPAIRGFPGKKARIFRFFHEVPRLFLALEVAVGHHNVLSYNLSTLVASLVASPLRWHIPASGR